MKKIEIITSWDDYHPDNYRIAKLLKKYKIPAIFFIQLVVNHEWVGDVKDFIVRSQIQDLSKDFKIGSHTITHPQDLKRLTWQALKDEIKGSKEMLEDMIKKPVNWFCYPRGRYNDLVLSNVVEAGYKYARTTLVGNFKKPQDNFRIKTSLHCYPRKEYGGIDWLDIAKEKLNDKETEYFHLFGHAFEITRDKQWDKLEELFDLINKNYDRYKK